jgi:hypothetical protein
MGLDMYLNKKTFVWSNDRENLKISGLKHPIRGENVKYIVEEAGYWRKANAIHQWFVNNVQEGEDDCKEYYVSEEQMKELLDLVNRVLSASKMVKGKVKNGSTFKDGKEIPNMEDGEYIEDPTVAKELLPTTSGFFFGGTEYDQWYIADLKLTKTILEKALKDTSGEYSYSSSW